MSHSSILKTHMQLIRLLQAPDQCGPDTLNQGWQIFIERYRPMMLRWCMQRGVDEHQAQDVCQDVFAKLIKSIPQYQREPEHQANLALPPKPQWFRSWLKTFVDRMLIDRWRKAKNAPRQVTAEQINVMPFLFSTESLSEKLSGEMLAELQRMRAALKRVQARMEPVNWEAFVLFKLQELSVQEVAERLKMSESNVRVIATRVVKAISKECNRDRDGGTASS